MDEMYFNPQKTCKKGSVRPILISITETFTFLSKYKSSYAHVDLRNLKYYSHLSVVHVCCTIFRALVVKSNFITFNMSNIFPQVWAKIYKYTCLLMVL